MPKQLSLAEAKARVIGLIAGGATVKEACESAGRSMKTYENWRATDKDFAAAIDSSRERAGKAKLAGRDPENYNLTFAQ